MQQLNVRNNEEVTCKCGKNQPIKYISLTKKTLHCSKCMSQCEGLVEYEPFQKALLRLCEKRQQTFEDVMKQIESTETLYKKIFNTMRMDLQKYQEAFNESKILYESFGCEDLRMLLQKLILRLDENQDVFVEIQSDKSISEIQQKLQKMNIYIKNELIECKEVENKTWLTEAKKLQKTGKKVYFLDEHVLIQETDNQIYLINQESAVLYQNKFDNKIMGLYKSPNNKIVIAREKQNLNLLIQDDKSIFIQKQIPLNKKIFELIFNEASDLIIYSCSDCIEFLQIKNHEVVPLEKRLPHDQSDQGSVPIFALGESNNQLVSMNLLGTIKIYNLNLENIYLKQTEEFYNNQFYDFLHFKNSWILVGIRASQLQIFQVNNSEKLINKLTELEIAEPKDKGTIIYKNDLLVQLTRDKVSIYRIKNAEIKHLVNLDFKSCELTSCDISQDGTQLIITGNTTVIYNLFY